MAPTLKVNEIFKSIQGESTFAGLPCTFIRLTGCNLRCTFCDTIYAYEEGSDWSIPDILAETNRHNCSIVEITGGEPLLQPGTHLLMEKLIQEGYRVLLETNGSIDIAPVHRDVVVVMDLKCPGSGEDKSNLWSNIRHLKQNDEVKFVIGSKEDFLWALSKIEKFNLTGICKVLFSAVYGQLEPRILAGWILSECIQVRLQLQMHKYIWDPQRRGV